VVAVAAEVPAAAASTNEITVRVPHRNGTRTLLHFRSCKLFSILCRLTSDSCRHTTDYDISENDTTHISLHALFWASNEGNRLFSDTTHVRVSRADRYGMGATD
jgi:hypothetical protein